MSNKKMIKKMIMTLRRTANQKKIIKKEKVSKGQIKKILVIINKVRKIVRQKRKRRMLRYGNSEGKTHVIINVLLRVSNASFVL
jgi:hypothetical protein